VPLASLTMDSVDWERHEGGVDQGTTMRSLSTISSEGDDWCPKASAKYKAGSTFYTAAIYVPVTLPRDKTFVPSFHHCLISRSYTLALSVCHGFSTALELRVPIQ